MLRDGAMQFAEADEAGDVLWSIKANCEFNATSAGR